MDITKDPKFNYFLSQREPSKNTEKLTRLRKSYETIRPRLLFLAKNEPNSPEYKELYYEAVKIVNTVEELIGPL